MKNQDKKVPKIIFSPAPDNEVEFEVIKVNDLAEAEDVFKKNKDSIIILGNAKSQCKGAGISHR
tara:strand:- start:9 stop:200 length:192 start_codon:yes stop_codon:yes gene_type:complete